MLNKYFNRREFACKCGCGTDMIDYELVHVVTDVREHFGQPVSITSGHRCAKHNASVGGAKASKHVLGIAADIRVKGVPASDVATYLEQKYPDKYGIGRYPRHGFTHIDVRSGKARWNG